MRLPTVLSPLFCCSVAGIPSSSTGSVALCEEVCQGLMDYGICVLPKCEPHWMLIMPESYFSSFFVTGRNARWCLSYCAIAVCAGHSTLLCRKHFFGSFVWAPWLESLHKSSLSLMPSCLAMRLICWKSICRYFFSFSSIDSFHIEWLHKLIAHELNSSVGIVFGFLVSSLSTSNLWICNVGTDAVCHQIFGSGVKHRLHRSTQTPHLSKQWAALFIC